MERRGGQETRGEERRRGEERSREEKRGEAFQVRAHLLLISYILNESMLTASPFLHLSLPWRSCFVVESIRSVHQLLGEVLFVARGSSEGNVRVHLALIYIIINDSMLTESPFSHLSLPRRFRFVVESI